METIYGYALWALISIGVLGFGLAILVW